MTLSADKKLKVHRFTNNLQGLQRVMVKDFSWNIIPWNALLFEKTLKQISILDIENNRLILNTCHDTAKRAETRVGFPVIFSQLRWPIEPKFPQVFYFIYKLCYTKCGPLDNTVYRCCAIALKPFAHLMGKCLKKTRDIFINKKMKTWIWIL